MKKTYRLYTYDLWADAEGGFSVNDVFRTADTLEVDDEWTDEQLVAALRAEGLISKGAGVEVDGNTDNTGGTIWFLYTEREDGEDEEYVGSPAFELREEENPNVVGGDPDTGERDSGSESC